MPSGTDTPEGGMHPVAGRLRIEELDLRDIARNPGDEWRRFRLRSEPCSPFLRPEYLALWAELIGGPEAPRAVLARRDGEIVGFGPFTIADEPLGPLSVPALRFIGNNVGYPGDVIFSDIAAVHPRGPIVRAILDWVSDWRVSKWDLGYVPRTSETCILAHEILGTPHNGGPPDSKPYVSLALPRGWEAFLQGLSGSARRDFRRKLEGLGGLGEVTVRTSRSPGHAEATVRALIHNHHRWWKGTARANWFGGEAVERFHVQAAGLLAARGEYLAFTLEVDGKPIAWNAGAYDGTRYFEQIISYDQAYREYSPGVLLGILVVRNLIALGASSTELGPGFDERKHSLGGRPADYERLQGYRGWLSRLAAIRRMQPWRRTSG